MILHDPQEFGGLEEYAVTLAVGLKDLGNQVSVLSTTWVPPDNQYINRLHQNGVAYIQVPKWLSRPSSHWSTKIKLLDAIVILATPFIYLLGAVLYLTRRKSWEQSLASSTGWLRRQLLQRLIAKDRYKFLTRVLLNWWKFRWHPDVIHIQGYTTNLLFVIDWGYANNLPVVYEEHQTPDPQFDWWKDFKQTINKAAVVVAVSDKSADGLRQVCGVTQPIVVRNPLLPDPTVWGWQDNGALREGNTDLHITTVARLSVAKGLKYLLETAAAVKSRYPRVQFRVYGGGELRQDLINYAEQLDLKGDEIFVGPYSTREELTLIMADTDIFLMSSILEGQPLALVEAMAYGRPIVTTSVGGIPELIEDGVNGLMCKPREPACLAEKIYTLIEDPHLRLEIGRAARRTYEQGPYQPSSVSNHFDSIYNQVIQQSRNRN